MINVENIHMHFGEKHVLKGVSLSVNDNEIVCLLGDNGQGKTTLLNVICGICAPSKGNVRINDLNISQDEKAYKKMIGYAPVGTSILEYHTIDQYLEFIMNVYNCKLSDEFLDERLEALRLTEERNTQIKDLSHGTKKKVSILASYLHNPKVLLLDEPLDGLDPLVQPYTFNLIKSLGKRRSVIIVTHSMEVVTKLANRVVMLFDGKIKEDGTLDYLYDKYKTKEIPEIYRKVKEDEQ